MFEHRYCNLRYGTIHTIHYRCADGHLIRDLIETIDYDRIVWG